MCKFGTGGLGSESILSFFENLKATLIPIDLGVEFAKIPKTDPFLLQA